MYSRKNMTGGVQDFSAISGQGMTELQQLQMELTEKYELDPIATANMAAEVIEQLTKQKMQELYATEAEQTPVSIGTNNQ